MKPMNRPRLFALLGPCISSQAVSTGAFLYMTHPQVTSAPDNTARAAQGRTAKATASNVIQPAVQTGRPSASHHDCNAPLLSPCSSHMLEAFSKRPGQHAQYCAPAQIRGGPLGCRVSCAHLVLLRAGRGRSCCSLCKVLGLDRGHRGYPTEPRRVHGIRQPAAGFSQSLQG